MPEGGDEIQGVPPDFGQPGPMIRFNPSVLGRDFFLLSTGEFTPVGISRLYRESDPLRGRYTPTILRELHVSTPGLAVAAGGSNELWVGSLILYSPESRLSEVPRAGVYSVGTMFIRFSLPTDQLHVVRLYLRIIRGNWLFVGTSGGRSSPYCCSGLVAACELARTNHMELS